MRSRLTGLNGWSIRVRTTIFTVGGFGALTAASWTWLGLPGGLAAGGLSLLIIEVLSGGERR